MKRLIIILVFSMFILSSCKTTSYQRKSSVQENQERDDISISSNIETDISSGQTNVDKSSYFVFEKTDWGMTSDEVLVAMDWDKKDCTEKIDADKANNKTIWLIKENIMLDKFDVKNVDVGLAFGDYGLEHVQIFFKDEESILKVKEEVREISKKYPQTYRNGENENDNSFICGELVSQHPKWSKIKEHLDKIFEENNANQKLKIHNDVNHEAEGKEALTIVNCFMNTKDGKYIGMISIGGYYASMANSL